MYKKLLFFLFFLPSLLLNAQKYDWLKTTSGKNDFYDKRQNPISGQIENYGEYVYIVGEFNDSINLGTTTFTTKNYHDRETYLAKYDTLGNFIWAIKGHGGHGISPSTIAGGIVSDENGNIYVHGNFNSDTCFWGNMYLEKRLNTNHGTETNEFIVKIDPNGNAIWIKGVRTTRSGSRYSHNLIIDIDYSNGILYISGISDGSLEVFPNGRSVYGNRNSVWVGKLSSFSGNLLDAQTVLNPVLSNTSGVFRFTDLLVTDNNSFYISVMLNGVENYAFGNNRIISNNGRSMIIAKYASIYTSEWVIQSNSQAQGQFYNYQSVDMATDDSDNLYFSGTSNDTVSFQSQTLLLPINKFSLFMGKISSLGVVDTLVNMNITGARSCEINMNNRNELYVTGHFSDSIKINDKVSASNGSRDIFLLNTDTNLIPNWYQHGGGSGEDNGLSVSCNNSSSAYFLANYEGLSRYGSDFITGSINTEDVLFGKISECEPVNIPITIVGDTNLCSGEDVRLFANTNGSSSVFQWMRNGSMLFGETNRDILINQTGNYRVIANVQGCIDTSRVISIAVGNRIAVTLTPLDTICENESPFQLTGGMPLGGIYSGVGVDSGVFYPLLSNRDSVQINYTYSNNGCIDSALTNLVLLNAPKPNINGQDKPCENTTGLNYSTNSPGPSYVWTVSGGNIVSGQGTNTISVDWGSAGLGIVSLQETNNLNCDTVVHDTVYIAGQQINSVIVGNDTTCLNLPDEQYAVSFPSLFYNWSVTGGIITQGQSTGNINVDWNTSGVNSISVQVFNSCGANTIIRDSVVVGTPPVTSILGADTICKEDFAQQYRAGSSTSDFQWFSPDQVFFTEGQDSSVITLGFPFSGSKSLILIETNALGCSDTARKQIEVLVSSRDTVYQVVCEGQPCLFRGNTYTVDGIYSDTLQNKLGCDSIMSLNLKVLPVYRDTINTLLCFGEPYSFRGRSFNLDGFYSDTLPALTGCDSILVLDLNYLPENVSLMHDTICEDSLYTFAGQTIFTSGTYDDTLVASNGCDSILRLNILVEPYLRRTITDTVCQGSGYDFFGILLYNTGTYTHLIPQTNGCDSLITLNLVRKFNFEFKGAFSTCDNELPFIYRGNSYTTHGIHQFIVPQANDCDSTIEFFLFVYNTYSFTDSVTICNGSSYNFRGQIITSPGLYTDSLQTIHGCDSVYNLYLNVAPIIPVTNINATVCANRTYSFGGQNLSIGGTYYDTLTTSLNCDSIIHLNLSVLPIDAVSRKDTICFGDTLFFFNQPLWSTGTFTYALTNIHGCDSIVSLQLYVIPKTINSISAIICSGDTFSFNNSLLNQTGVYLDTLISFRGCDSVVMLNLSVLDTVKTNISISICSEDTLTFNNQQLFNSGNYSDTLVTVLGCDSIVNLLLTVEPLLNDSVTVKLDSLIAYQQASAYQWLECDINNSTYTPVPGATSKFFIPSDSNFYAVEMIEGSCTDTSSCYKRQLSTFLSDISEEYEFNLFPNPTSGKVSLQFSSELIKQSSIKLYDLKGHEMSLKYTVVNGNHAKLDLSHLSKGVYFIKVETPRLILYKKVILQ